MSKNAVIGTLSVLLVVSVIGGLLVVPKIRANTRLQLELKDAITQIGKVAEDRERAETRLERANELLNAARTNITAMAETWTNQIAGLNSQLSNSQKRVEIAEAKKMCATPPAPNQEVLKVLDRPNDGSSIVHMWTGTAATLHELKKGGNDTQFRIESSATSEPNARRNAMRTQELQDSIEELERQMRDTEVTLCAARRNARADNQDPGVNALRRAQIREMEINLEKMDRRLSNMLTELQNISSIQGRQ